MSTMSYYHQDILDKYSGVQIVSEAKLGSRLMYMTTGGTLDTAHTAVGFNALQPNYFYIQAPSATIESTALTTASQIGAGGVFAWRASGGKAIRISTAIEAGTVVTVMNLSTGASGVVCVSTNAGVGIFGRASTFGTTACSSACFGTLSAGAIAQMVYASAGFWMTVGGTGAWATFSTVQTASA